MGFEDQIFRKIDRERERRQELSPSMERAHRKALITLRNPDYAIQERDFVSIYGEEAIRKDQAYALRLRSEFDRINSPEMRIAHQMAEVFEAVILEESELSNWLGEGATTFKTADYDDFHNKVDMIVEWHDQGQKTRELALASDVTYGTTSLRINLRA